MHFDVAKTALVDAQSVAEALQKAFTSKVTNLVVHKLELRTAHIEKKRINLDTLLQTAGWGCNNNQTALGAITAYWILKCNRSKRRVLISSPPGTGKSRMVASIAFFIVEWSGKNKSITKIKYVFSHANLMNVDERVIDDLNTLLAT